MPRVDLDAAASADFLAEFDRDSRGLYTQVQPPYITLLYRPCITMYSPLYSPLYSLPRNNDLAAAIQVRPCHT